MQFINYQQMAQDLLAQRAKLPISVDLVVGIPRSGMIPACMISAQLNLPVVDLDGLLEGRVFEVGRTKETPDFPRALGSTRTVLVVDDIVGSGLAFREAKEKILARGLLGNFVYCSVYGSMRRHPDVDILLIRKPPGTVFQWNVMHHRILANACVDIDGVLCCNPDSFHLGGGSAYSSFIESAVPLHRTSGEIGWLVTSRLERYREQTEQWLARHRVAYRELVMATEEDKLDPVAYKARVYGRTRADLFIESECEDARGIAEAARRPVLCMETMMVVGPEGRPVTRGISSNLKRRKTSSLKLWTRSIVGEKSYKRLKSMADMVRHTAS